MKFFQNSLKEVSAARDGGASIWPLKNQKNNNSKMLSLHITPMSSDNANNLLMPLDKNACHFTYENKV